MPELNGQIALLPAQPSPVERNSSERDSSETKVTRLKKRTRNFDRRLLVLTDNQKNRVKQVLKNVWSEWEENTSLLQAKLRRSNDIMEGIKEPKNFPWVNSSNLHMPIIEIHITILHSMVQQTMLENDPIWYVKIMADGVPEKVDTDVEAFLNAKAKIEMKIDETLSDIYWNAFRDGTAIGDLDWVEDHSKVFDIYHFTTVLDFQERFPTPSAAGISDQEYNALLAEIIETGETQVQVEETIRTYQDPKLRVVELKDFVVSPVTSPTLDYAMFVGDIFVQRADYFRMKVREEWFDRDDVDLMLKQTGLTAAPDQTSQSQDTIEGLGRTRKNKPDEYQCLQGVLKINIKEESDGSFDDYEPECMYLVTYERKSNALLRIEHFPYWHNRCKYILWRIKKRSNRLLGQSIYDQLIDINDEIDTQHNQRIDSRTITTVPSFLKKDNFQFDPTRKDQRFFPGVTFTVSNFDQVKQFDIKQTDMGTSLQEEQNLMYLADLRTGASQLRSGQASKLDPRAPAKKIQLQLQQSTIRADDHMRELRIGTNELASQILELYYQFSPESIVYARKDPETALFVKQQIARSKLRQRNMFIEVARTTIMDNPLMQVQKLVTEYQILSREPLIAQNIFRRRELVHRLLKGFRERDIDKILPTVPVLLQELQQMAGMNPGGKNPVSNLGETLGQSGQNQNKTDKGGTPPTRSVDTSGSTQVAGG